MHEVLRFDEKQYTEKVCELEGRKIRYRAYEGIPYCANPVDPIQKLNLFVPALYYEGEQCNGYDLRTAPIFMPNTVGGYMPGPADVPGYDHKGRVNSIFRALQHGYVVVSAGIRGRSSGRASREFFEGGTLRGEEADTGKNTGKAPALIVDMKAALRYLRFNKDRIPGNTERIITNGTSAGGALSALAGAAGNCRDYEPYLKEIGAAEERDDIFAASCYCPIHNLEHADMAYEWQFADCREYYHTRHVICDGGLSSSVEKGVMSAEQIRVSEELKALFPAYLNSLDLKTRTGETLFLNEDGTGSFLDYMILCLKECAQRELENPVSAARLEAMNERACPVEEQPFLKFRDGRVSSADWKLYVKTITRMKPAPAFDALDLSSPENKEFGESDLPLTGKQDPERGTIEAKHFTEYSFRNSTSGGQMADKEIIKMMNPLSYIGTADTAPHWRIRHGMFDRDTSVAIPMILASCLGSRGYDVDFELPWGLPHSGDYDLDELFAWIDGICQTGDA